jgi:excinuclease ABC subunit A
MPAGMPEDVVKEKRSYTGQYLKPMLARGGPKRRKVEAAD